MTLSGQGSDRVIVATVPPLQVGQVFCFDVTVYSAISESTLRNLSHVAAQVLVPRLAPLAGTPPGNDCFSAATTTDFDQALQLALNRNESPAGRAEAAKLAVNEFRANGLDACNNARLAASKSSAAHAATATAKQELQQAYVDLAKLPVPSRLNQPVVVNDKGTTELATKLIDVRTPSTDLQSFAAQLQERAKGAPILADWARLLTQFSAALQQAGNHVADQNKVVAQTLKQAQELGRRTSLPLEVYDGRGFIPAGAFLSNPDRLDPVETKILNQLAVEAGAVSPAEKPKLDAIKAAVENWLASTSKRDEMLEAEKVATADRTKGYLALEAALAAALSADVVRQRLTVAIPLNMQGRAGRGVTPDKGNYASVDLGMMAAAPQGGRSVEAWIMPYVGLNVYLIPVDRTIGLSELTGTPWQKLRQRVSITVGTTLTAPSLSGRTTQKPIGVGNYPLAALGVRASQYTRIAAGAVFYDLADKNPASAEHSLRAAPFLSASLDADIVQLLTDKVK